MNCFGVLFWGDCFVPRQLKAMETQYCFVFKTPVITFAYRFCGLVITERLPTCAYNVCVYMIMSSLEQSIIQDYTQMSSQGRFFFQLNFNIL